jgi:hypothetical protein|eukprot:TRINITY_DN123802_c0_g2_i1.p1 TRINITY_DN123802_c0_g2~~TRINITY_DN123802_c0_g2_i1.p1  ORF type:complete len:139 (-),score=6.68 TRINITY_DN123802_c0_g2_i1:497-913(-)
MATTKGVLACEQALERLLDGKATVPAYVGINSFDITPATVSVEAGFDKGYLKRSRDQHKSLIARIDSLKKSVTSTSNQGIKDKLLKANKKIERLKDQLDSSIEVRDKILTQNLMLLQKVRQLEQKLPQSNKVIEIDRR